MIKLKQGDDAPSFIAVDENGKELKLEDYQGKKLILFFYPRDNTPGCTLEACNLRDNYELLKKRGYEVVGVSADSQKKHQNFINKYTLPFRLIADIDRDVIEKFGVWGPKKFMGREFDGIRRTTFIIDENGKIEGVLEKVKTKAHTEQILELMGEKIKT